MTQDTPDWLQPAIRINPSADVTQPIASGANVVNVNDTSGFRVGDTVAVTGKGAGGQQTFVGYAIDGLTATQVTLSGTVPQALSLPGAVVAFPSVIVQPASGTPGVPVVLQQLASGLVVPVKQLPLDWTQTLTFNAGQTPSLGEVPGTGTRLTVTWIEVEIETNAATSFSSFLHLSGPTTGTRWNGLVAVPASPFASDRSGYQGPGLQFALNETVTLACGTLGGTTFATMSMGGYID